MQDSPELDRSLSDVQIGGRWNSQEHQRFLLALMVHGKNWKLIQSEVQSRTTAQVRSHAQKFFLKISKVQKQRKKNLKKGILQASKNQQQLRQSLQRQSFTHNTPTQILHFLNKKPQEYAQKQPVQNIEVEMEQSTSRVFSKQVLNEVLNSNQDQSFFVTLMYHMEACSKRRLNSFLQGGDAFTELIDFPCAKGEEREEEETVAKRKMSFTLYDQQDDPQKYKQTIKKMSGL